MFRRVGAFSVRNRLWITLGWVVLSALLVLLAPSLRDVARLSEEASLPPGVESLKAKRLLEQSFPEYKAEGTGTIILYNPAGLSTADMSYARALHDWLRSDQAPPEVTSVSTIFDDPQLEQFMLSPDKTVMLMQVVFSSSSFDESTVQAVKGIRQSLPSNPPEGLKVYVSGGAGISADLLEAVNRGIDRTTQATVVLVIVLLLIIYRSPVAALVPLITITCAYLVSRGALGYLAQAGLSVWSQVDAYLVVIVFGVGTDYCLFIMSRLREEMARAVGQGDTRVTTMERIGVVITASAATVIVGFLGLLVGQLEMFRTLGPFLAIAVFITLIAALTLTPALASLFGSRLFWPAHAYSKSARVGAFGWSRVARLVTSRPALSVVIAVVILLVPYTGFFSFERSFNILTQLPEEMDSIAGFRVLEQHYDMGEMTPLDVIVVAPTGKAATEPSSLSAIAAMTTSVAGVEGVKKVRSPVQSSDSSQWLSVKVQLEGLSTSARTAAGSLDNPAQGSPQELGRSLTTIKSYLDELAAAYSQVTSNIAYYEALGGLAQLKALLTASSTPTPPIQELKLTLTDLSSSLGRLAESFRSRPDAYLIPRSLFESNAAAQGMMSLFFSQDDRAVRLSVVLDQPPYSTEAFDITREVRQTLKASLATSSLSGGDAAVGGSTAEFADVHTVTDADFVRVFLVVFAGVFVVLALLLRSLVAPLYLLITVLLSYGTTLGLSAWVFQGLLGHAGVFYLVPIFLLVMLVALGEDYNIFLMSRVREESENRATREGVRIGVGATGGIITACGLILAGTFATMVTAPIQTLLQVGGAIAIGILIDTFLVRAFLVPGIAALMGRWNWWPGAMSRKTPSS